MVEKHKELLDLIQQAEKVARGLHDKGCYVEPVVIGLRDLGGRVADRIRAYERTPAEAPAVPKKKAAGKASGQTEQAGG